MVYDNNNVFAKILRLELPCKKVYEDDTVLAFHDVHPEASVHILVIPKDNFTSFDDFISLSTDVLHFFQVVKKITHEYNLDTTGYRLITNHGRDGGQIIPHFHMHILGGKNLE